MRATGNAGLQSDPAGIATHDFDSHDPVMRFGGGVDFVDRVGGRVQAVSKPKVTSVADRSLSIVLGTPTSFMPFRESSRAIFWEPSPPIVMMASRPSLRALAVT